MRKINLRWFFNSRAEMWEWTAFASAIAGLALIGLGIIHAPG
jgi:hypothetical protein